MIPSRPLLVLAALLLSGCSDGGGDDATSPEDTAEEGLGPPVPADQPVAPVVLSDTFHLLSPPDVLLAPPVGNDEEETPVPFSMTAEGTDWEVWGITATRNYTVTGAEAHLWFRVTEPL